MLRSARSDWGWKQPLAAVRDGYELLSYMTDLHHTPGGRPGAIGAGNDHW